MGSELIDSVTISKPKSSSSTGKCFPPGFRFHPTDEELVLYYLKRKICRRSLKLNIIGEVDVYKWDPEELPGQSKLKTGDRQWFFFSPRDRKYPNGGRTSRATLNGYWKATGKDRIIKRKSSSVGIKKTLVYYQGRAPSGVRTDWVMHEYTLDEQELKRCPLAQEHFVLYKVFKKSGPGPKNGEQYGAVFVEEEWNDEDCLDVDSLLVQKPNPFPLTEAEKTNTREEEGLGLSDDIVEFLNKVIEEPKNLSPEPDFLKKNEHSLLVGSSSQVEKDFLEMNDLSGPVTGNGNLVTGFGSFSEFDFYHDSQGAYNMENLEYGPGPENLGMVGEGVNHDYALHDELPINFDLWNHYNQVDSSTMTSQTVLEPVSIPSTGVVVEENPAKPENHPDQCPENMENDSDSLFSSALWAFVDSIPTTPASASESNALVNRAIERMSSFSRGRKVDLAAVAASGTTTGRLEKPKPSSSSRGIVFYSVLGVLFAMLWVFLGSSMELLKRFVWL